MFYTDTQIRIAGAVFLFIFIERFTGCLVETRGVYQDWDPVAHNRNAVRGFYLHARASKGSDTKI